MKNAGRIFCILFLLLMISYGPALPQSQQSGVIEGRVTTAEGEPLPGVEVTISSPALIGGGQSAITNDRGRYRFVALLPGVYAAEAKLSGFNPQKKEDVRVRVGETLTVDFVMTVSKLEATIAVIGQAPLIDVKDSQTAVTVMENEYLQQIPSTREMRDQLGLAPGVSGESAFGASESLANSFLIDGVRINSPEAGEAEVRLDYDSIQEMKIEGVGANAEYDGFGGVVVETVTKSGGNTFGGLFDFYLQPQAWNSSNTNNPDLKRQEFDEVETVHFNLGGPVIKDKLWFFSSGKYYRSKVHNRVYEPGGELRIQPRTMGKLTWQMNADNRLMGFLEYSHVERSNIEASPFQAPESTPSRRGHQFLFNAQYIHIFSASTFLEAKFGGYIQKETWILPQGDIPPHYDLATNYLSQNYWEYWDIPRSRFQINTSVSHHADDFIKGSHDFKVGVEFESSWLRNKRGYPGGKLYYDLAGAPYYLWGWGGYNAEPRTQRIDGFIQDSWSLSDRIKINPGLRVDSWRGTLQNMGTVFKPKLGIAPRLGITIDPLGDHSTAIKLHYGKYYHGIMGMFYLHLNPEGDMSFSIWGPALAEKQGLPPGTYGDQWVLQWIQRWDPKTYTVDPNLKMTYMNQYTVGVEREILKDLSAGATFIYRTNHDFIDRVNLTGRWEPVQWTDPVSGGTYNVYKRLNPGENQFLITNPEGGKNYGAGFPNIVGFTPARNYAGIEFSLTKRFSNNWQLQVSYVLSKAWGSDDNAWGEYAERRTSSLGASTLWSNPNYQINADGRLTIDPTHIFKIVGSFVLPLDITVGAYYSFITGNNYNKYIRLPDYIDSDPVAFYARGVTILAGKLGSFRYPSQHNLDLRVEKAFNLGRTRMGALLDIFNVFNSGTITNVEQTVEPWGVPFGYVWEIRQPRSFRAGFRVTF